MNLTSLFDATLSIRLTLTLGHFLWQGLAIAVAAGAMITVLRRASARARYVVLVVALAIMAACPLLTFCVVSVPAAPGARTVEQVVKGMALEDAPSSVVSLEIRPEMLHSSQSAVETTSNAPLPNHELSTSSPPAPSEQPMDWQRFAPLAAAAYLAGVLVLLSRLMLGLHGGRRMCRRSEPVEDRIILDVLARQVRSLGLCFTPAIAWCRQVTVPVVVGVLRPTILLPLSLATGLAPNQVAAILTHELAHIRRYDHLVDLAQRLIEAFLFFHPAVWWLSRRIRIEREHCCDDLVVSLGATPLHYAESLLQVAELSQSQPDREPVPSIVGLYATTRPSRLRQRVARLLSGPCEPKMRFGRGWTCTLAVMLSSAVCTPLVMKLRAEPARCVITMQAEDSSLARESAVDAARGAATVINSNGEDITDPFAESRPLGQPPHDDRKIAELIERVRENERLYQNLETVIRRETWFDPLKWPERSTTETLHIIRQGKLFYFEDSETHADIPGAKSVRLRVSAFDGEKTTSIEFGNSANIHFGRYEPSQVFPPHTWAMSHLEVNFPLSVFLAGTGALKQHPKVRRFPSERGSIFEFYKVECEFVGQEKLGDLMCVKIRCKRWYDTRDEPAIQYLWLAPERNFLCVKTQTMLPMQGEERPASDSFVEELREIKPGVWLPVRVRTMQYSFEQLRQNLQVVDRTLDLIVEKAVPDPQYPLTQFGSIEIPDGLPTYTIGLDGKLKNSARHPTAVRGKSTGLQEIVQRIRENEQHYAELDLTVEEGYRKDLIEGGGIGRARIGGVPGQFVENVQYGVSSRTISAGGKHYYREEQSNRMADGRTYLQRLTAAFDGDWTRKRSETDQRESDVFEVAWASLQKGTDTRGYRPHTMVPRSGADDKPLSKMLVSEWSDRRNGYRQTVEYEGDDILDGLLCHRIRIDVLAGEERRLSASRFIWLAKDRNYLPIRSEWREASWSQTLPTGITTVSEFREVKKGIWFPYHVTTFAFKKHNRDGLCEKRLIVNWRHDYHVQSLLLSAEPEPALFDTVIVPANTKFLVMDENGEVVGSQVQEEDGNLSLSDEKLVTLLPSAEQREADNEWGPEQDGLRTRLALLTEKPTVGQPLKFRLEMKYFGKVERHYDPQNAAPFRVITVKKENGEGEPYIGPTYQTAGGPKPIKPGETVVLWDDYDAAEAFLLAQTGKYVVQSSGAGAIPPPPIPGVREPAQSSIPASNAVTVELAPGELPEPKAMFMRMYEILPNEKAWRISMSSSVIFFTHSPTNLKKDVTTIELWFDNKEHPPGYSLGEGANKVQVERLGETKLGFAYMTASVNVKELWPEFREKILSRLTGDANHDGAGAAAPAVYKSMRGSGKAGNGDKETVRAERWQLVFPADLSETDYARALDYFSVQLAIESDGPWSFISPISARKPRVERREGLGEEQLSFTWQDGPARPMDLQLVRKTGITPTGERTIHLVCSFDTEQLLARLEIDYLMKAKNHRDMRVVRRTQFVLKKAGDGYKFEVESQQYYGEPESGNTTQGMEASTHFFGLRASGAKFIYVIDRSGSMSQRDRLGVAKRELLASIEKLPPDAQFQVIFYNLRPVMMPVDGTAVRLVPATEANRAIARRFLDSITADGGTEHVPALKMALDRDPDVIFFLTDSDDLRSQDVQQVTELNKRHAQIHCIEFGIGKSQNRSNALRELANLNDGTYQYIDAATVGLPKPERQLRWETRGENPFDLETMRISENEQAIVITGGVTLLIKGVEGYDTVALQTDRMVIWRPSTDTPRPVPGSTTTAGTEPLEMYLEGNVVLQRGSDMTRGSQMYYDADRSQLIVANDLPDQSASSKSAEAVYVRATKLREKSKSGRERQKDDEGPKAQAEALKRQLQQARGTRKASGTIISVDNLNSQAYVDRGSADQLPIGTTFSVWEPNRLAKHAGELDAAVFEENQKPVERPNREAVQRPPRAGDSKACIEIVSILGPHQSLARITRETPLNPITPGDLVFSPVWAPGRPKRFALAGQFDVTGRGTNQRELLVQMITMQGGVIDAKLNDDATLEGEIKVDTHWLVLGSLPTADSDKPPPELTTKLFARVATLKKTAHDLGVEIIDQAKLYELMGLKGPSRPIAPRTQQPPR